MSENIIEEIYPWMIGSTEQRMPGLTSLSNVTRTLYQAEDLPFRIYRLQLGTLVLAHAKWQQSYNKYLGNETKDKVSPIPLKEVGAFVQHIVSNDSKRIVPEHKEPLKELTHPQHAIDGGEYIASFLVFCSPALTYFCVFDTENTVRWHFTHFEVSGFIDQLQQEFFSKVKLHIKNSTYSIFKPLLISEGETEKIGIQPNDLDGEMFKFCEAAALTSVTQQFNADQAGIMNGFDTMICNLMPIGSFLIQSVGYENRVAICTRHALKITDQDQEQKTIFQLPDYFNET